MAQTTQMLSAGRVASKAIFKTHPTIARHARSSTTSVQYQGVASNVNLFMTTEVIGTGTTAPAFLLASFGV